MKKWMSVLMILVAVAFVAGLSVIEVLERTVEKNLPVGEPINFTVMGVMVVLAIIQVVIKKSKEKNQAAAAKKKA